jgi:hypothetical protein
MAAVVLAMVVAPLAMNAYLPLEDLPNHIARRYLAVTSGGALDAYYTYHSGLATNSAVDMAWLALGRFATDAIAFSRWAVGFGMVGFVFSVAVLHRVLHGHWSAWPLASALLVYNASLLWGFENFFVTVPLAFLAIALWIVGRDRSVALRLGTTLAVAALLYLCHVLVFLAYAIIVFSYEAAAIWREDRFDLRAARWTGLIVIGAICLAHLVLMASGPEAGYGASTSFGRTDDRVEALLSPFGRRMGGDMLLTLVRQSPFIYAVAALVVIAGRKGGLSLAIAPGFRLPLIVFGIATLLMPEELSGVHLAQIRFPAILLGLLLAGTDLRVPSRNVQTVLAVALIATVASRAYIFDRAAQDYSAQVNDLRVLSESVPSGARVLPVRGASEARTTMHWHTAAYLVPFANAFLPTLFVRGSHSLGIAAEWMHLSAPQPVIAPAAILAPDYDGRFGNDTGAWDYLEDWEADFTHVLAIGPLPAELVTSLPIERLALEGEFTLYAVRPAAGL